MVPVVKIGICLLTFLATWTWVAVDASFEPYQLNGGLVSAVAGRDYVILASDSRLTDGGYGIYTRRHVSTRLWALSNGPGEQLTDPDGSIYMPSSDQVSRGALEGSVLIGSAGCSADCESLKQTLRAEIDAFGSSFWSSQQQPLTVSTVSTLLGQVLYSRRSFPFYSFCVVAGLDVVTERGAVYVYDAIGSHEQVAVAATGTGREILQPILDRLFSSTTTSSNKEKAFLVRDGNFVSAADQQGSSLTLSPPVATVVDCSEQEAVSLLLRGYRSVSEREIAVGDNLVICILRREKGSKQTLEIIMKVQSFPLKQH
eukprot:CAMPEP_0198293834 /NCGR_PEP_ID=MMETSP1449-20131203/19064_1 /TAXON_ID=420275 /ORGANISM="Attheya septentrionalis, Strain CCMP2084" /LENGTH=313 /DNA_ID=CAMNT_0043993571 /DNA_START=238 /DNA_END=1179 /DNA_ORIENTATION=-